MSFGHLRDGNSPASRRYPLCRCEQANDAQLVADQLKEFFQGGQPHTKFGVLPTTELFATSAAVGAHVEQLRRTLKGDITLGFDGVLVEMLKAAASFFGKLPGNKALARDADPLPQGDEPPAKTADEAVKRVGDTWATVAQLEHLTGLTQSAIRSRLNRAADRGDLLSADKRDIPESRSGAARHRYRVQAVWQFLSECSRRIPNVRKNKSRQKLRS